MRLYFAALLTGVCALLGHGCAGTDGPPPLPPPAAPKQPPRYVVHYVRPGDTLFSVGRAYGVPWQKVRA